MTEEKKSPTITELIDADEGLKSKRKILTITSLILLALTFSGAKVEEANTFILKLKFDNQNGIAILLVLTIVFLIIRYYNYAKPYHEKLFRAWSDRMLDDGYFLNSDVETRELFFAVN
jgi:heme/copper-type cytochrome/quinol oxidase subunit 3